jgi:S1-C subfamily serine protease
MVGSRRLYVALATVLICRAAAADTVLLDFTTPGCGPCRMMRPVMQQLVAHGYHVREVDASLDPTTTAKFHVDSFPTFIVLVDGAERARQVGGGLPETHFVQMIHKAEEIAGAGRTGQGAAEHSLIDYTPPTAIGPSADGAGLQPQPGRVVPISATSNVSRDAASAAGTANADAPLNATAAAHLIAATVRISVQDPEGRSTGSGTIVDARQGKALVLTCGHLFRSSAGKGAIEISLFAAGPSGAELRGKAEGELIHYDLDRDLALVCFVPQSAVEVTPVAPAGTQTVQGAAVTSVGCEHGANPTPWGSRITAVNRFAGHPNIEAARAPVEGRSGGGLFNESGQLIGVCYAADPRGNEGLYASLASIQQKLDTLNLAGVYQAPSVGNTSSFAAAVTANQTAAANSPFEVRGQSPTPTADPQAMLATTTVSPTPASTAATNTVAPPSAAPAPQTDVLSAEDQATLRELGRRAADAEIICIIRPKSADGRSEVLKLDHASPALVRALQASRQQNAPQAAVAAAPAAADAVLR